MIRASGAEVLLEEEAIRKSLEQTLLKGFDDRAFDKEELVGLTLLLWRQQGGQHYRPSAETMEWLRGTPYFKDYLAVDPAFDDKLAGSLSESERRVFQESLAQAACAST